MKPTPELLQAIKKYRSGNAKEKNKAFDVIYSESYKYIYTCVYRAVSGNDNEQDIIKEVMQETYIEICKSFEQLKDDEAFLNWGARIAVTGEKVKFTNWSAREPNGEHPEEDYAMFFYWNKTSVWNDGDFGVKISGGHKAFICEWDR